MRDPLAGLNSTTRALRQRRIMMRQLMPLGTSLPSAIQPSCFTERALPPSMVNSHCDDSQLGHVSFSQQYRRLCRRARVELTCPQRKADEDRLYRGQERGSHTGPTRYLLTRASRNESRRKIMYMCERHYRLSYCSTVDIPPLLLLSGVSNLSTWRNPKCNCHLRQRTN